MLATPEMLNPFGSPAEWDHYAGLARRETFVSGVPDLYVRNLGFHSVAEQQRLQNSRVAISGAGGDGAEIARLCVRTGIGCGPTGELILADPEVFGAENINRQTGSAADTIGSNKALNVAKLLLRINPSINLRVYTEGLTEENQHEFMGGTDLVIDEAAYEHHELAVMTNRRARKLGIPVLQGMNLGWAGIVTTMHPEGPKFEEQLGFCGEDLDTVARTPVPVRHWVPYLPAAYGDYDVLEEASSGRKPAPSIAEGMAVTAALTVTEAKLNIWHGKNRRRRPTYFDRARVVDLYSGGSKSVRYRDGSFYRHGAYAWVRNRLRLNPKTDFMLHPNVGGTAVDWPRFQG